MSERAGRREAMDRFVKQLVTGGNDHKYAKQKARDCAIRADRRDDKQRNNPKIKR
jgi:hypothetical protein